MLIRRVVKRVLVKTLVPVVRSHPGLVHELLAANGTNGSQAEPREFASTGEYLVFCHKRVVAEVQQQLGTARVPGHAAARPHYVWGVVNGAYLARALGIKRVSVIDFGVAGGNGLVALELIAEKVAKRIGVDIDVYGFDTGKGSPKATDYRDAPNLVQEADYQMDVEKLQQRLTNARLVLGPVGCTVPAFLQSRPAPVAFAAFDFAQYHPTAEALSLFSGDDATLLPRVQCYFVGTTGLTFSDFTADRLAISEFNASQCLRKISPCYGLESHVPDSKVWAGRMFLAHFFDHRLYGAHDGLIKVHDNPLVL
jgi:hypothetical protein